MTTLPPYLRREIDRAGNSPRVLVEFQKDGTVYWDATGERLFAVALHILRRRVANGMIPSAETVEAWKQQSPAPELTKEQIDALPEGRVKTAAVNQRTQALLKQIDFNDLIVKVLVIAKAIREKDGVAAWIVLTERSSYEYERVELCVLSNPEIDPLTV
jgi:hypothetical protein